MKSLVRSTFEVGGVYELKSLVIILFAVSKVYKATIVVLYLTVGAVYDVCDCSTFCIWRSR